MTGRRLGILGGTFDPIHRGHLIAAETARREAGLDQVILMPTGCSYFKEDQKVTPASVRYEMVCAAAEGIPGLSVSDLETRRPGRSYTAVTLRELSGLYPEDDLFYIVGADTLVMMSLWRDPSEIFRLSTILVMSRDDEVERSGLQDEVRKLRAGYGARIVVLPGQNAAISSTDIRRRVREGKPIRGLVPEAVETMIRERGLYRDGREGCRRN